MVIFDTVSMLFWGVFSCFAEASLSLRSLRDYETTSLQVYNWLPPDRRLLSIVCRP